MLTSNLLHRAKRFQMPSSSRTSRSAQKGFL